MKLHETFQNAFKFTLYLAFRWFYFFSTIYCMCIYVYLYVYFHAIIHALTHFPRLIL